MCAKCGKQVDRMTVLDRSDSVVVRYAVECHGEREESLIGIWAAIELVLAGRRRLPDAFKENP